MPRWAKIIVGIGVAIGLLFGGAYVCRSEIATAATAFVLDRDENAKCTHPEIEVAASLDLVHVSPVECRLSKGPLKRMQTFGRMRITLDGFDVKQVHIPRATFDARDRDVSHVELNTLGDIADLFGASQGLIKGVLDGHDNYQADPIPMTIGQLTTLREGKKDGVMYDYREWKDGVWYRSNAARMSSGTEGLAEVRNFDMRIAPNRARLSMGIYLGEAERGEEPDAELRLESRNLNDRKPKFEMELSSDESREARRERLSQDARAARQAKAPPRDRPD